MLQESLIVTSLILLEYKIWSLLISPSPVGVSTNVHEGNFCTTPGDVRYLDSEVTAQKIFSGALLTEDWKFIKNYHYDSSFIN